DPKSLLRGLMESLHSVTRAKAGAAGDVLQSAEEREAASLWASQLGWANIHRLWQMLLKGLGDVGQAPDPNEAAAMALLRLIHAADLPDPAELIRQLRSSGEGAPSAAPPPPPASEPSPPASFAELIERLEAGGEHHLGQQLRDCVGLVDFAPGMVVLRPLRPLGPDFARRLAESARKLTGNRWEVSFTDQGGSPSLGQQEQMAEEQARAAILSEPNVRALLDQFPDATLETVNQKEA
ncbi:MAG TPA: DNA polymerase III subunit gamma/tau, partial [Sphingomicrobium sp.]|nr:DNA polymerase III subunit gamma/tau [Sphingomicrobium sp.]